MAGYLDSDDVLPVAGHIAFSMEWAQKTGVTTHLPLEVYALTEDVLAIQQRAPAAEVHVRH